MRANVFAIVVGLTALLLSSPVWASEPVPTAVMRLELGEGVAEETADELADAVRRAAQNSPNYAVAPDVSIGLNDSATLLGCSPTTPSCLKLIAKEVGVSTLVYGELRTHGDDGLQLELNIWDAEQGPVNRITRTLASTADPVAGFQPAVDELFAQRQQESEQPPQQVVRRGSNWGAWSALSVGLLCVGGSVAAGIAVQGTQRRVDDEAAAGDLTQDRYRTLDNRGQNLELAHRVLLGVGLVGAAVGVTWLVINAINRKAPERALLSPSGAGIQWTW